MSWVGPRTVVPETTRVAVLRALKIGDLLCAVPVFRAIRDSLPDARITLIGLPWAREFVRRFAHLIDDFREFPGWPGLPEIPPRIDRVPDFLRAVQEDQFHLAVQLHGSGRIVNEIIGLFGARRTAGFYPVGDSRPDSELFVPWPERGLEVRRLLTLTDHLGFRCSGEHLEFPLFASEVAAAKGLIDHGAAAYACLHPGASVPERRWPAERFAAVADRLADEGLRIVLTGTADEQPLTREVAAAMSASALDLAGRADLGTSAAVIAGARLLVCNDTAVSHVAAAVRTPSVVVSTGGNPARWAPADRDRHRVLCVPGGWPDVPEVLAPSLELLNSFVPVPPALDREWEFGPSRPRRGERVPSFTGSPGRDSPARTRQPA